jgi:hypothetical protein
MEEGTMAAQEHDKHKKLAAKATSKAPEAAEVPIASEVSLKELGLSDRWVKALTNAGLETAQDVLDSLGQGEEEFKSIHDIGPGALEEIQGKLAEKGFRVLQDQEAEVEQDRQAQAEAALVGTEPGRAPAEANKASEPEAENPELPSVATGEKPEERPVSFRLRVTVDAQGEPLRTEIQPAKEDEKPEKFLGLNGQELAAYMRRHISEAPTPESLEPAISVTVSDVWVSRAQAPGVAALILNSGESFVVQTCFRLGPEALSLTAQESAFQTEVLATELTSGKSILLATPKGKLTRDVLEYPVTMRAPGLPPGLYRLLTLVTLQPPINMLGHYEGPIIRVTAVEPSANASAPLEASLSP